MSKKHYAATYKGRTFTRSSDRTYTHAIIVKGSVPADRAGAEAGARSEWVENQDWHQGIAAGRTWHRKTGAVVLPSYMTAEQEQAEHDADVAKSKAWLAQGEAGLVAERLARFDARQAEAVAKGMIVDADGTYYGCSGWAGRPDLAAKEASKAGGVAVEAVVLAKKGGAK